MVITPQQKKIIIALAALASIAIIYWVYTKNKPVKKIESKPVVEEKPVE